MTYPTVGVRVRSRRNLGGWGCPGRLSALSLAVLMLVAGVVQPMSTAAQQSSASPTAGDDMFGSCSVAPLTVDELQLIADTPGETLSQALGTPLGVAAATPPAGGVAADPEDVAGITATINELLACTNAGDLPRMLALLTESFRIRQFGGMGGDATAIAAATPTPLPPDQRAISLDIAAVQTFPDGRVSAAVTVNGDAALLVFAWVDDRYLIDDSFSLTIPPGTPVP